MNQPAFNARETLSVGQSSTGFTAATYGNARYAIATVEAVPVRVTVDGTAASATVGHLAEVGDFIRLKNQDQIRKFRAYALSGTASLQASFGIK